MKLLVLTVFATLVLAAPGAAFETPADQGYQGRITAIQRQESPVFDNPAPVWERLAQMSPAERANAVIDIESTDRLARTIEALWNGGRFDEALALFPELGPTSMGVSWRVPIAAPESDWGEPVQVSTRDSIYEVELAADTVTGNLFSALRYVSGTTHHWSINLSTNGGASWSETYEWFAGWSIPSIALTVAGSHAFVGYCRSTGQFNLSMRRFLTTTGASVNFPSGGAYFSIGTTSSPDTVMEVAMASNYTLGGNRVYAFYNTNSNVARVVGFATDDFDTFDFANEPTEVERGLDIAWNYYPAGHPLVFSYINPSDQVRVYGYNLVSAIDTLFAGSMASNGPNTSLAVWKDTIHVVFHQAGSSVDQVRYLVQYDTAGSFFQGGLGDTTLGFSRHAAATGRRGDGVGVTYWQYPQGNPGQCFRYRDYSGSWTPAVTVQTSNTYSTRVPAIERVAPGIFGVVFHRGIAGGVAHFNRNDWTGIAEQPGELPGLTRRPATIVRSVIQLQGTAPAELLDAAGRRVANLAPGTNDLRHLSPGVYFLHSSLDSRNSQPPVKVILQH